MKLAPPGILGMALIGFTAHAEPLSIPTPEQAHAAVITLLGDDLPPDPKLADKRWVDGKGKP